MNKELLLSSLLLLYCCSITVAIDLSFYENYEIKKQVDSVDSAENSLVQYSGKNELSLEGSANQTGDNSFYSSHLSLPNWSGLGVCWVRNSSNFDIGINSIFSVYSDLLFGMNLSYTDEDNRMNYIGKQNELFITLSPLPKRRVSLYGGRKKRTPGPALSYNPTYQLPIDNYTTNTTKLSMKSYHQ